MQPHEPGFLVKPGLVSRIIKQPVASAGRMDTAGMVMQSREVQVLGVEPLQNFVLFCAYLFIN
jgi:hypothetical protein